MNSNKVIAIASLTLALILSLAASRRMQVQDIQTAYPSMAPIGQYLASDRNAEIALARSAAPDSISRDAKVLVLGPHGYETAVAGKNGFVCVVERSWMLPFDDPEFWNPKVRLPLCINPPGSRSHLPLTFKSTKNRCLTASRPRTTTRNCRRRSMVRCAT